MRKPFPVPRIPALAWAFLVAPWALFVSVTGDASGATLGPRLPTLTASPGAPPKTILFSDTFNRPNNANIGNGWIENEPRGTSGAVDDQQLCFLETSDEAIHPQVLHSLSDGPGSLVEWRFVFDWARTGPESTYQVFLQLGDAGLMTPDDVRQGVAVNLVWSAIDGVDETLGYYDGTDPSPLSTLSGQATLLVVADSKARTYEVLVDDTSVGAEIPFDQPAAINSIRLMANQMDEANFSGRCFDSMVVSRSDRDDGGAATSTPNATSTAWATSTPTPLVMPSTTPTAGPTAGPTPTPASGVYPQWSTVELALLGPASVGMSNSPNPFAIPADVTFTSPSGTPYVVPTFYDGDGAGAMDGDVWKVRFSPPEVGNWSYRSESSEPRLDGQTGTFNVIAPSGCDDYQPGDLPDFDCLGRLVYTGGHYLQFAAGPYWLKGGIDDPEDFLAPASTTGFPTRQAAADFLASQGVNSLYMLLHNVGGDGQNVWPWVGGTGAEARANHEHFDLAKLAEWEAIFSYLQSKGITLHLVLEDDSAWTGFNRGMYYREMVARFGHHPGLIWNLAEEYNETYSASQIRSFAGLLRALDPYDHPITVHNAGGLSAWTPFVDQPNFDLTSFQTGALPQNAAAVSWFSLMEGASRTIPVSFDETGQLSSSDRTLARHIVWSVYLGGGNFELHASPLTRYQDFTPHLQDLLRARTFMEALPFCEMVPMNGRLLSGQGYAAGRGNDILVAYLPVGGSIQLDLRQASGSLDGTWVRASTGEMSEFSALGGAILALTSPFPGDSILALVGEGADVTGCR
jgi:Domain of unknown function (DUF5060)